MERNIRVAAFQVVAAILLIVAATVLPWATYRENQVKATTTFRGGPISGLLLCLGAASIVLSLLLLIRRSTPLRRVQVVVGCAALIGSMVLALSKISMANHVSMAQESGGQTSYAFGAGVAILASATVAVTSFIGIGEPRAPRARRR